MTDEQIEAYRQQLNELTNKCSGTQPESRIQEELKKLASEVGASTRILWVHPTSSTIKTSDADTSELIRNIHQALQTASMANMCRTATQGYEIATKASRHACIHYWIVAAIALLSVVAAWVAAIRN